MMLVWKVLRPQFWRLDHAIRKKHPVLVTGVVAVIVLGGGWLWPRFVDTIAQALSIGEFSPLAWLPPVLFSLIILAALQLADTAYTLYLNPYTPLLLTAPLSNASLFLAKWLECTRLALLPALVIGGTWMATTQALALHWVFYPLGVLAAVLIVAGMTTLGVLLVMLLVRILPIGRLRTALPIFLTVTPLVMLAMQDSILETLRRSTALAGLSASVQIEAGFIAIRLGMAGFIVVLLTLGAAGLFRLTYLGDVSRMQERPTSAVRASRSRRLFPRLPLPPAMRGIILKDWLETFRKPGEWLGLLIQPLLIAFMMLPVLRMGADDPVAPVFFWMMVALCLLFSQTALINQAMSSVAGEGRCLTLLKTAPLSARMVHRAKWLGARWILTLPVWWGMLFLVSGYMGWSRWAALIAALIMTAALLIGTHMGISLGMRWTNFMEVEPGRRFPRLLILGVMVMSYFIGLIGAWTTAWLVYLTLPKQAITLPLTLVAGTSFGTWTLSGGWEPALILTIVWLALSAAGVWMRHSAIRRWDLLEA